MTGTLRAAVLALALLALPAPAAMAGGAYWQEMAQEIAALVDDAVAQYEAGDGKAAGRAVIQAYFGQFESRKMEAAIRKEIGGKRAFAVEKLFGNLRKAVKQDDQSAVRGIAAELRAALAEDGKALDAIGVPPEVFQVNQ